MIISELLSQKTTNDIQTIPADVNMLAMAKMLSHHNIGALIVPDEAGGIAGVVSERDLARALIANPDKALDQRVADVMTRDVLTCNVSDNVVDVLDMMNRCGIRHVPVLENGTLISILSIRDFNMAYQRLQSLALTDYMTGLSNRRHFMDLLAQEIHRRTRFGTPLSLAMIDIDNFKAINDTHGHAAGDQVICGLATLLKEQCRIYDIVGRLGGEEYAILSPNTDLVDAGIMCRRIVEAIRRHRVEIGTGTIGFTASFGLYEMVDDAETPDSMLAKADELLYRAKEAGRDRIVASCEIVHDSGGDALAMEVA